MPQNDGVQPETGKEKRDSGKAKDGSSGEQEHAGGERSSVGNVLNSIKSSLLRVEIRDMVQGNFFADGAPVEYSTPSQEQIQQLLNEKGVNSDKLDELDLDGLKQIAFEIRTMTLRDELDNRLGELEKVSDVVSLSRDTLKSQRDKILAGLDGNFVDCSYKEMLDEFDQLDQRIAAAKAGVSIANVDNEQAPARKAVNTIATLRDVLPAGDTKDAMEKFHGELSTLISQAFRLHRRDNYQAILIYQDIVKQVRESAISEAARVDLDTRAREIGSSANKKERAFLEQALKARFDVQNLSGKLSSKALPQMYELLRGVPEDHTFFNNKLLTIERSKSVGASSYSKTQNAIVLNAGTAGGRAKKMKYESADGTVEVKAFDAMFLHEVGHSVDDKKSIMKGVFEDNTKGGWKDESDTSIIQVAGSGVLNGADSSFFDTFATIPRGDLEKILTAFFKKTDPAKLVASLPNGIQWNAIKAHPARAWLEDISQNDEGNWRRSTSELQSVSVGGYVYQQSYTNIFWRYHLDSREHIVRNYQFRAPGEWFAELYSMYYMRVLGEGHTHYSWLRDLFGEPSTD